MALDLCSEWASQAMSPSSSIPHTLSFLRLTVTLWLEDEATAPDQTQEAGQEKGNRQSRGRSEAMRSRTGKGARNHKEEAAPAEGERRRRGW